MIKDEVYTYLPSVRISQAHTRRSNEQVSKLRHPGRELEPLNDWLTVAGVLAVVEVEAAGAEGSEYSHVAQVTIRLCASRDRRQIRLPFMS